MRYHQGMAAAAKLLEQALKLSPDERGRLIADLIDSLEPDEDEVVEGEAWEQAWAVEIERRAREVEDGTAELVDGDVAMARVRAAIAARR
jgi:putative addiction module component (TIGR02574 family)